nr:Heavy-metal-associated domain [Streptococcus thermophilus]
MKSESSSDPTNPITTPTPHLLSLALNGCGCCTPSTRSATASVLATTTADATPDPLTSYQMEGLNCGHCAGRVTVTVQALPLVDDVQVDLAAGGGSTVTVTGAVSGKGARQANEEVGYAAF